MYNNESGSPALDEFLELLGQKVRLKGFTKFRAQLDNKSKCLFLNVSHDVYCLYDPLSLLGEMRFIFKMGSANTSIVLGQFGNIGHAQFLIISPQMSHLQMSTR